MRIDSHQHFWEFDPIRDSWINNSMTKIKKDFLPDDLIGILANNKIDGCIAVQADQSTQETKFLLDHAAKNSFIIAIFATIGSIILGTLAALGLSSRYMPYKGIIMATLISPMIVPLIISGVAIFFFMAKAGLAATHTGIVLAHIILGTPFVVITVTATLTGFDHSVTRAASSLGSNPVNTFMKITLPLILPGVISGGLFAFVTSFDEVVVVLFLAGLENTTIPIQMWTGLREQLSPTILAVATCLIVLSTLILVSAELLRRRSERLRGINR